MTCSSRLDRLYTNAPPKFCDVHYGIFVQSDHNSLHIKVDDTFNNKKRSQNRFPDHLLKNKNFMTKTHSFLHKQMIFESSNHSMNLPETYHNTTDENLDDFIRENMEKISIIKTPRYKKSCMIDLSTQIRKKKIDIFTEKILNPNAASDSHGAGLLSLGEILAASTNDPESSLNAITSCLTQEAMRVSKQMTRSSNGKLRDIIKQLINLEKNNQYNSAKYQTLVQKRTFLEAQQNFRSKFYSTNKHAANNDKCTAYFLSNLVFSSRLKVSSIVDKNYILHKGAAAAAAFSEHFTGFFQEEPTSNPADSDTIQNSYVTFLLSKSKRL